MKVSLLNHAESNGGAARAVNRLHYALQYHGVESKLVVCRSDVGGAYTVSPKSTYSKLGVRARPAIANAFGSCLSTTNTVLHSPAVFSANTLREQCVIDADLIHLHWINGEMLSVADIGRIQKPTVWTLHDMWAFCGAEHYTEDFRWRDGYSKNNRPNYESGFDLNRWTWARKRRHWQTPLNIVTPSRWLAECVKSSVLMKDWPVEVIPNAIDTDAWRPINKQLARSLMGLPADDPMLLFGAMGGGADPRKGFDLLIDALQHLRGEVDGLRLLVFGQETPLKAVDFGFPITYMGRLFDDISLRALYSAADAMVIPSRQDNLPNTGLESLACGTPVIAFDTGGMTDIVDHKRTGYLASAFDSIELAEGLRWVLSQQGSLSLFERGEGVGALARRAAVERFSYEVVAPKYIELYSRILRS